MTAEARCIALSAVAFTLRITQGADEAEEFSFDGEARMGRTADNDVVIKDPSSSRSHARVYEEDGRFFVEDMKSANGTTLNKKTLKAPAVLETGDRIAIGDVILEFAIAGGPSSTLDGEEEDEVAPQSTLLKPPSKPAPPPRNPTAQIAGVAPARELRKPSRAIPAAAPAAAEPEMTAADRARERRELQRSTTGRVQLLWNELPPPTRIVVGVVGLAATLGILASLVLAVLPKRALKHHEVEELVPNGEPISESFGAGAGVDFPRPDMKSFSFTFAAPTAIVGLLHYQARDCGKDEVSIELNGTQLGTVPPDTVEVSQRQLDIVLPSTELKVNATNEIVFDNVNNPPANDPWRIWNVWVEVIPIPRLSADEAAQRAKADLERAAKLYELRGVGAMNLFRSWKEYRDAWLLLEATPEHPAELLQMARARMRELRPELDKKCQLMLMGYQREMNQKYPNTAAARRILQDVPSYFEKEHPCFGISRGLLAGLEDLGEVE